MKRLAALAVGLLLVSCSALKLDPEAEFTYTDPSTGEEVTTTVGDAVADQIESAGSITSSVVGKALGVATGNPVVGVSAAALLSALVGSGAAGLRRKRKVPQPEASSGEGDSEPSA